MELPRIGWLNVRPPFPSTNCYLSWEERERGMLGFSGLAIAVRLWSQAVLSIFIEHPLVNWVCYAGDIMYRFYFWFVLLALAFVLAGRSDAAEFHLSDGTDLSGEVA